jgi:formate dehydrogenase major subunit
MPAMGTRRWIGWPAYRQVADHDLLGLGAAVKSKRSERLAPRVRNADNVAKSVCPYCAVGCGQNVYVKDEKVIQIEGDPDSPVSRGRMCPKGSASLQLTTGEARQYRVRYRRPFGKEWEDLDLDTAMDMIADRVIAARRHGWQWEVDGARTRRTLGLASLGGATAAHAGRGPGCGDGDLGALRTLPALITTVRLTADCRRAGPGLW